MPPSHFDPHHSTRSRYQVRADSNAVYQGQKVRAPVFYLQYSLTFHHRGFFRRDKHVVVSTSAPIIIDKHELHSTWPVYAQPETRNLAQDGVTLTVDRTHTCYGPGDRVSVNATVKSDATQTVILRGFEFALRETMVFRAGGTASGKRGAPQVKMSVVGEQKVPVNATLYGGTMQKAELAVTIPERHTTTTLNAARHIDITYVLSVRALLGTGQPIIMDLPVIISNWPKYVIFTQCFPWHLTYLILQVGIRCSRSVS
jgi:hypothetical protein